MASNLFRSLEQDQLEAIQQRSNALLGSLVQSNVPDTNAPDQYVGEVVALGYETAVVQIHDFYRRQVGGIPSLCFLIATRLRKAEPFDYTREDASVLLLRVLDRASLPNDGEIERIRAEAAQRASGEQRHWDEEEIMDAYTANLLSFAGVRCRVIGTFYLDQASSNRSDDLVLRFGSDISNYYPNRGLKVYKPNGAALSRIVNYMDPERSDDNPLSRHRVIIGEVRYASTNRAFQNVSDVSVRIAPIDLLDQKTALFGMTRTGKSNTTKIIAKSVFALRFQRENSQRIGQIIFDYNGEYANENVQDPSGSNRNPSALKNVWRTHPDGSANDVVTYGTSPHPQDPGRRLMKLDFFSEENLQIGKEIINQALVDQRGSKYIDNFIDVALNPPESGDRSAETRYRRSVLAYRTLLVRADFDPPSRTRPRTRGLFNPKLIKALRNSGSDPNGMHAAAAEVFSSNEPRWSALADAFESLRDFISRGTDTGYADFNREYIAEDSSTGSSWHDTTLEKILEMFRYQNGARLVGRVEPQHDPDVREDYADEIYSALVAGRLVIVDQSAGHPEINQKAAERVMWRIFNSNQAVFTAAKEPPHILVYAEEAHNLLPSGSDLDLQNVWVRTAKEGSKLHIGLVYITQEVSSIQKNILKNTANWFIGHLNNTDETRELCKYYDYADFEPSIRRAQDRGFLRVKTLSNLFVVPVQITRFEV